MQFYLQKRVSLESEPTAVACSQSLGWSAFGCSNGSVTVFRIDQNTAESGSISQTTTLAAHKDAITCLAWNDSFRKLTTCDASGLTVVWALHREDFKEEMRNSRPGQGVLASGWSPDGSCVAVAYSGGTLLCGSVEGHKLWVRETGLEIKSLVWRSDEILVGYQPRPPHIDSAVAVFDGEGVQSHTLPITKNFLSSFGRFTMYHSSGTDSIIILDDDHLGRSIEFDTEMKSISSAKCGSQAIAVAGAMDAGEVAVSLFSYSGFLIRRLRLPSVRSVCSLALGEGFIAIACDRSLLIARCLKIEPSCLLSGRLVFVNEMGDLMIGNSKLHEAEEGREIVGLLALDDESIAVLKEGEKLVGDEGTDSHEIFIYLSVIDSAGLATEPEIELPAAQVPLLAAVGAGFITCNTARGVWMSGNFCASFNTDNVTVKPWLASSNSAGNDMVTALASTKTATLVGCESGRIYQIDSTNFQVHTLIFSRPSFPPRLVAQSSDGGRLGIVDLWGDLAVWEVPPFSESSSSPSFNPALVRKEVYDILFASDDPVLFAVLEKNRLYVFRGERPEEPISVSGALRGFSDLTVSIVRPDSNGCRSVTVHQTKALRQQWDILKTVRNFQDAMDHAKAHPHPRTWRMLAEGGLADLSTFPVAKEAFSKSGDWGALEWLKRVEDEMVRSGEMRFRILKAERHWFSGEFDQAKMEYEEMGRADLAERLALRCGFWSEDPARSLSSLCFLAVQAEEELVAEKPSMAAKLFLEAGLFREAVEAAAIAQDDGEALWMISQRLVSKPLGDQGRIVILKTIANHLINIGSIEKAVSIFVSLARPDLAFSVCEEHGRWDLLATLPFDRQAIADRLDKATATAIKEMKGPGNLKGVYAAKVLAAANQGCPQSAAANWKVWAACIRADPASPKWRIEGMKVHLVRLAHRLWYAGNSRDALLCSQRATDLFLSMRRTSSQDALLIPTFAVLALSSAKQGQLLQCSGALVRLKSCLEIGQDTRALDELCIKVFGSQPPRDKSATALVTCPSGCKATFEEWRAVCPQCTQMVPICTGTGRTTQENGRVCSTCRFKCCVESFTFCPLCHDKL